MKNCNTCNIKYGNDRIYCEKCGNKLTFAEPDSKIEENNVHVSVKPKKSKQKIVLITLCIIEAIALAIAGVLCVYFQNEWDYQLGRESDMWEDYWELKEKYDFYYEYSAIIDQADDEYYHRYDCPNCEFDYFMIFTSDNAESRGYAPCPICW